MLTTEKYTFLSSSLRSFAAGVLLGAAFFDLMPEAFHDLGEVSFSYVLLGILIFFILERFIFWHHCHTHSHEIKPHAYLNLIGDGVHNFVDGAIIAATWLTEPGLGIIATIAIALHEIPQELGDFAILVHGGMKTKKALFFNFLSALMAFLGAIVTVFVAGSIENVIPFLVALAAGGSIYIATTDLFPELQDEENLGKLLIQSVLMIVGLVVIYLVSGMAHIH